MGNRSSVGGFFYDYNAHLNRVFENWEIELIFKLDCKMAPHNSDLSELSEQNRTDQQIKEGQISLKYLRKCLLYVSKDFNNCPRILPKTSLYDQVKRGEN